MNLFSIMLIAALAGIIIFVFYKRKNANSETELIVGGIYSIQGEGGKFKIVKILSLDYDAIHICLYKNTFFERPASVNTDSLSIEMTEEDLDVLESGGDLDFGVAHLPIDRKGFIKSKPVFIIETPIDEQEMDGFNTWKNKMGL